VQVVHFNISDRATTDLWGHPIWTHDFRPTPTGWRRDCNIVRQEAKWRGRVIIDARGFTAVQGRDWL
jgi:hypothetical protein